MDHVRCGEGLTESSVPGLEVVVRGESGRNELLRGPFALFGVRIGAKLVRNLAKHRRTPMSPPPQIMTIFLRDKRLVYTPHHPVRWLAAGPKVKKK